AVEFAQLAPGAAGRDDAKRFPQIVGDELELHGSSIAQARNPGARTRAEPGQNPVSPRREPGANPGTDPPVHAVQKAHLGTGGAVPHCAGQKAHLWAGGGVPNVPPPPPSTLLERISRFCYPQYVEFITL